MKNVTARGERIFAAIGPGGDIVEFAESTATVDLAAAALGVEPRLVSKSLTFKTPAKGAEAPGALMVVSSGDRRIDNRKFKQQFGFSPKMLNAEEALQWTGFRVGGICPFALPENMPVYLDRSLERFEKVYLACGDPNSMIGLAVAELFQCARAVGWADISQDPA